MTGTSDSSSVLTRTADAGDLVARAGAHLLQRGARSLEHRAGVRTPQQRLRRLLGRGLAQAPVAQHHVDAVAGRGERRGHALEPGQPGERIAGRTRSTGGARREGYRVTSSAR